MYNIDDEFLYGDSLLVAPVLSGSKRTIYLPRGLWRDWWTGDSYTGGKSIEYTAPLERLPLFVKAGSVVPMQPSMNYSGESAVETLSLHVLGTALASATTVYDDDGETLNYRKGEHMALRAVCRPEEGSLTLTMRAVSGSLAPPWKRIAWRVADVSAEPLSVLLGSRALKPAPRDALEAGAEGYRYDPKTRVLTVQIPFARARSVRIVSATHGR